MKRWSIMRVLVALLACLLASAEPSASSAHPQPIESGCPGCADNSGNVVVSPPPPTGPYTFFIGCTIDNISGDCLEIPIQQCVEAYPCTPWVTVRVLAPSGYTATGSGRLGGVGLGESRIHWPWPSTPFMRAIYADFSELSCGKNMDFYYHVSFTSTIPGTPTSAGYAVALLSCSPCED